MRTLLNEKGATGTKARLSKQNKKLRINEMLQAIFRSIGLPPRRVDPKFTYLCLVEKKNLFLISKTLFRMPPKKMDLRFSVMQWNRKV